MSSEPSPMRDNGPYASAEQAENQFDAVAFGLLNIPSQPAKQMILLEALLAAGVKLTDYEKQATGELVEPLTRAQAQVIAGWVMRARLSGQNREDATS